MKRLRFAILSGVRHAAPYLEVLSDDPRVEVVAVAEEREAPGWAQDDGRRVAASFGVAFEADLGSVLDPDRIDVALVCTEPTRHARVALRALEAGLHVVIDKPLAATLAEAEALLAAAEQAAGHCTVVNRTHAAAVRRARRWVDAGHIGMPLHVDYECLASGTHLQTSVERPELILDPALAGGGELFNFLGYGVDAVRYLTGLEVVDVCAMTGTLFDLGHAETGLEDTAIVSLGLERGVTATLTVGRVPYAPTTLGAHCSFRMIGSHGHAVGDDNEPTVQHFGPAGAAWRQLPGARPADLVVGFFDHVIGRLQAGSAPEYGVRDAWRTMQVIDASYRSADSGRVQSITKR